MIYRVSSAHEEAGERVYSVSTSEFIGDDDGNVASLRLVEVRFEGGQVVPSRGPNGRSRPSWCCWRWASPALKQNTVIPQLGVALDERGNVARDKDYATNVDGVFVVRRRRPRSVADRLGNR